MAQCIDPSLPIPSDLSVLEKQEIHLNQQQKHQNRSASNSNFSPFPAFKPVDEDRNVANVEGYNPIYCLGNGWPDFSMVSSTRLVASDSDTVKDISRDQITENIMKRKSRSSGTLKAEQSNATGGAGGSKKKVKLDSSNGNHGRNESIKEGSRKGKNKKNATTESSKDNTNDSEASTVTPKPDYIHVRARRGQATDSHSLAERVRRERISERMRYLQELVPGCDKVIGKAGMLDEIINYVQSLQRQVEFLSMKLAAVNPTVEFDIDELLNRQMNPSNPSCMAMIDVLNNQLDPSLLQFNLLQRPAACYSLEMPIESPNPAFNGSMPDHVSVNDADPYLNVNFSSSWDIGLQNLYCNQPRTLSFPF